MDPRRRRARSRHPFLRAATFRRTAKPGALQIAPKVSRSVFTSRKVRRAARRQPRGGNAMSARTFGTRSKGNTGRTGKYQLDVTADDVTDLVRSAGGWLYDRSKAGWDVNVVVTGGCNPLPLQILGVSTEPRELDD